MGKVFLSYAGADRAAARRVVEALRGHGLDAWWDADGIGYGERWRETLEQQLEDCSAFVLLVGALGVRRWVRAEVDVALDRHFGADEPLPIFPVLLPEATPESLPPFLGGFQAAVLSDLEPARFEPLAAAIRDGVAGEAGDEPAPDPEVCPFPGLVAYDESSARFFFGRQQETLHLLGLLGRRRDGVYRRWLHVHGASGSGKSSLVKAGLVPAVKAGWSGDAGTGTVRRWQVAEFRPGSQPVLNLATGLARGLPEREGAGPWTTAAVRETLAGGETGLRDLARDALAAGAALLLVVDQLEEVFTMAPAGERERLDALLAAALEDDDGPLHLASTIRDDFVRNFPGELPRLHGLINSRAEHYFLGPMGEAGLRDAVQTPTRRAGLTWSEPGLAGRIVEEASNEKGALFLVGNLMRLLWERQRERGDGVLSAADHEALGGVGGALAKGAETLLGQLGAAGREHALRLLTALVQPGSEGGHARRRLSREDALRAAGDGEAAETALALLSGSRKAGDPVTAAGPRLVVVSAPDGDDDASTTVDLAHEALLRTDAQGKPYWPTLHDRVEAERSRIEARQQLEAAARLWEQGLGELAGEKALDYYRGADAPTQTARRYLRASHDKQEADRRAAEAEAERRRLEALAARRRKQRLRVLVSAASATVVLLAAAGWLSFQVYDWGVKNDVGFGYALRVQAAVWRLRGGLGLVEPAIETVPDGSFRMGSEDGGENERPVRTVTIARPFAMGKYEVTFEEYDVFAAATDRPLPDDRGWGRGDRPVVNVSWKGATAYAEWLSAQTGKRYRLPSEAEWEYAARAGSETAYWWGDEVQRAGKAMANCRGCGSEWDGKGTAPVGQFPSNAFGLHDLHGNVWEWVADCWHGSYTGAPDDGSAWLEGEGDDCGLRVLRGGSWGVVPRGLRSANRDGNATDVAFNFVGFRLAQDQ